MEMTAAVQEKNQAEYEKLIINFRSKNGFQKVGHKGFAVLTTLWETASKKHWDEKISLYNKDLVCFAALRDAAELYVIREKLIKHGFLKKYIGPGQGSREKAIYFLNYNF
ncbi:MAG: hypothetical protein AB2421_12875 [Thermotaleaceae bacterium]